MAFDDLNERGRHLPPSIKTQTVGYVRVSSLDQNPARQLDGYDCDRLFVDHASGASLARPALDDLMRYLRSGDTLIVHSMDRLARNLDDLRSLVLDFTARGAKVQFIKENLTFTGEDSPINHLLLSMLGAVAQFERDLIRERQREGVALAKERGVYKGRKPHLTQAQIAEIAGRVAAGESKSALAREYGVKRMTIYRTTKPKRA
jgi:DNA invertase Pin-like site-specific DNA recombinase